jgi:hypothetical protein
MVRACRAQGGDEKCIKPSVGKPERRDNSEETDVDGKIILKCILGK